MIAWDDGRASLDDESWMAGHLLLAALAAALPRKVLLFGNPDSVCPYSNLRALKPQCSFYTGGIHIVDVPPFFLL